MVDYTPKVYHVGDTVTSVRMTWGDERISEMLTPEEVDAARDAGDRAQQAAADAAAAAQSADDAAHLVNSPADAAIAAAISGEASDSHAAVAGVVDAAIAKDGGLPHAFSTVTPQYVCDLQVTPNRVMQSFARHPVTGQYFVAQANNGNNETNMRITRCAPDGTYLDEAMLLGGGHGTCIGLEEDGTDTWLWIYWDNDPAGVETAGPHRFKYRGAVGEGGSRIALGDNDVEPVPNMDSMNSSAGSTFSIDKAKDRIAVRVRTGSTVTFTLRKLSEYKANTGSPVAQTVVTIPSNVAYQGHVSIDDHVYVHRGGAYGTIEPHSYRFDWGDPDGSSEVEIDVSGLALRNDGQAPGGHNEAEGMSFIRNGDGTATLLLGIVTGGLGGRVAMVYGIPPKGQAIPSTGLRSLISPGYGPEWVDCELSPGLAARDTNYTPRVSKDRLGNVTFVGQMAPTGLDSLTGTGALIMTIPEGYRPIDEVRWIGFSTFYPSSPFGGWIGAANSSQPGQLWLRLDKENTHLPPPDHWCIILPPWQAAP